GIGITGGVVLGVVFPALLRGASPLGVALTGGIVIAVSTIYLAHGVSDRTTVALVGTIGSLLLTARAGGRLRGRRPPKRPGQRRIGQLVGVRARPGLPRAAA